MGRLRRFLRLSRVLDDLENRLLIHEYRCLLNEDLADDGSRGELQARLRDVSREIFSMGRR